jgi:pyruvate/2-oxoglutarate dehydrogenase complex dihydrolipoamide acyltransferase (E2) component
MTVNFTMPDLGLAGEPTVVSQWLVDLGGRVAEGDRLLEVSADGVTVDLPSPIGGVLAQVFVYEDDSLSPGMRLAKIEADNEA